MLSLESKTMLVLIVITTIIYFACTTPLQRLQSIDETKEILTELTK